MYVRKCIECGNFFTTPSARLKICSEECQRSRNAKMVSKCIKERAKSEPKKPKTKICKICKKEFTTSHGGRVYCSEECRKKGHYEACKPKPLGRRVFKCEFCGNNFEADAKRKFCTKECRENAERARKRKNKPKKPKLSLNKIAKLSREEGLSYGQYVAKYGL